MSLVSRSIGLVSGLNYAALIQALLAPEQKQIATVTSQDQTLKSQAAAVSGLAGTLLPLTTSATDLGNTTNFNSFAVHNSDPAQLTATTTTGSTAGNSPFQSLRLASPPHLLSQ